MLFFPHKTHTDIILIAYQLSGTFSHASKYKCIPTINIFLVLIVPTQQNISLYIHLFSEWGPS